jgi:hypothetical protein
MVHILPLMLYRPLTWPSATSTHQLGVLPNRLYDPKKGADEYQSHIDRSSCGKLGFDVIASMSTIRPPTASCRHELDRALIARTPRLRSPSSAGRCR